MQKKEIRRGKKEKRKNENSQKPGSVRADPLRFQRPVPEATGSGLPKSTVRYFAQATSDRPLRPAGFGSSRPTWARAHGGRPKGREDWRADDSLGKWGPQWDGKKCRTEQSTGQRGSDPARQRIRFMFGRIHLRIQTH